MFVLAVYLLAAALRMVGLFRGLEHGGSFHPDVPKQMRAVENYLKGIYVWYTGSLAYDGYPFGLNHVDEWLIRALWPAARAAVTLLRPEVELPERPTLGHIYEWCLVFRVLYSLAALAMFHAALLRLPLTDVARCLFLLLGATAPLGSTVTHAATGDVGTDLFAMLAMALFVRARTGLPGGGLNRVALFAGIGFGAGLTFACKYHGVLVALAPGLWLLLAPMRARDRLMLVFAMAFGAIGGFVLLTPHVLWKTKKTLELIWLNFHYIRNYNVSEEFLRQPLIDRIRISVFSNLPVVVRALGMGVTALGALAALLAVRHMVRRRDAATAWNVSVVAMPFAVILLALIGKPELQPFHFSFLPLPLIVGVAAVWSGLSAAFRFGLLAVVICATIEQAFVQRHEWQFWAREDIRLAAKRLSEELIERLDHPSKNPPEPFAVAHLAVEGWNLPVFRNRPRWLMLPYGDLWRDWPNDRLPAAPLPVSRHWIWADLPAFPRESRLLALAPKRTVQRFVIQSAERDALQIELTSGPREVEVWISVDGRERIVRLDPCETATLSFPSARAARFRSGDFEYCRFDVRARVRGAMALARIGPPNHVEPPPERAHAKLSNAKFLAGSSTILKGRAAIAPLTVLTLGRYRMEVRPPPIPAPLELRITSVDFQHPDWIRRIPFSNEDGRLAVEWDHTSEYLFAILAIESADVPQGVEFEWVLRPLAAVAGEQTAVEPAWGDRIVSFGGGRWQIGNLRLPERLRPGERLQLAPRLMATADALERLHRHSAFIHLLDEQGRQVFAQDIRLNAIPSRRHRIEAQQAVGPIDLPPGRYEVRIGIYDLKTHKRVRPDEPHGRDRRVSLGWLQIN